MQRTFYNEEASIREIIGDFYISAKGKDQIGFYKIWEDENAFCNLFVFNKNSETKKILFQATSLEEQNYKVCTMAESNNCFAFFSRQGFEVPEYKGFVVNNNGHVNYLEDEDCIKGMDELISDVNNFNPDITKSDCNQEIINNMDAV